MFAMASDYDGAWKDLLHCRLSEVLDCYFPEVARAIDWSVLPEFLEQELRALAVDASSTDNRIDLLIRVRLVGGGSQVLYLHIEVQSFREDGFATRMARSFHGIRAACGEEVVTLVVLADLDPTWKPVEYRYERLGCETMFRFPCCKLLEILPNLEGDVSFPALAARAQIEALRTSRHPDKRLAVRWRLTRSLYECGYGQEEIREAFRLLAWMMRLPEPQLLTFRQELVAYEKAQAMLVLTDIEEYAMKEGHQKGRQEGRQEAIKAVLKLRYKRVPSGLLEAIEEVSSEKDLDRLLAAAATCETLEEFAGKL